MTRMNRRLFLLGTAALVACSPGQASAADRFADSPWRKLSDAEWKKRLSPEAYRVLRHADTERAGSSPLNNELRRGTFVCAGCALPLFKSEWKYDAETGWPSFWTVLKANVVTKPPLLPWQGTEYHCARCLGHQGHMFTDGPPPTGQRWCNNGVALRFSPV
ncbi:peptide-methionine (R)-S-oxide reductase MsrB [Caulobacter sp. 17J65-9]|nr:peptide-methionine (R)-S-oxide reductase MsrB [Caulobacter sp. 17J65-9]